MSLALEQQRIEDNQQKLLELALAAGGDENDDDAEYEDYRRVQESRASSKNVVSFYRISVYIFLFYFNDLSTSTTCIG